MSNSQLVILAILCIYLLVNVVVGIIYGRITSRRSTQSLDSKYFLGGRGINGFMLAMTTMATYLSVSSFLSGPGAAGMTYGYAQAWVAAVQVPVTFLVLGVLGNKLALVSRRTGAVTVVGYLKARYKSDALVMVTSLFLVVFFVVQMVAQFKGGANLIQSITGLGYVPSLLLFGLIVIAYTSFGGFSAVAITDAIQGLVMCIGTFLFIFFVLKAGGGLTNIDASLGEKLPNVYDNLFAKYPPGTLLSFWILVGFGTLGLPQTAVRAMSFKDTKSLHQAMWIGALTCSFVVVGMHLAGVWAGALADSASLPSSDYLIPFVVQKIMPVELAGLFLAAPMAAVMSTTDSLLLLASAAIVRDILKTYFVGDRPERVEKYNNCFKTLSTAVTIVVGCITILLAMNPPNIIFFLNLYAMGGLECAFFWPLVGGLFWQKGTKQAALMSAIAGVVVYIIFQNFVKIAGINGVVWGILASGAVYFIIGRITSQRHPLEQDIIDSCF